MVGPLGPSDVVSTAPDNDSDDVIAAAPAAVDAAAAPFCEVVAADAEAGDAEAADPLVSVGHRLSINFSLSSGRRRGMLCLISKERQLVSLTSLSPPRRSCQSLSNNVHDDAEDSGLGRSDLDARMKRRLDH